MSEILFIYSEQARRADIQAALGGDVWWSDLGDRCFWRPEGATRTISIPYQPMLEDFDADEFVANLRTLWEKRGIRFATAPIATHWLRKYHWRIAAGAAWVFVVVAVLRWHT